MAIPRITGRQMKRSNVPSATPEEFYRRNVYLPLLTDFENQLRDRFNAHKKVVVGLNMLLPKFCGSASLCAIDDAVQFYLGDIPSVNAIEAEFTIWLSKCCQIEKRIAQLALYRPYNCATVSCFRTSTDCFPSWRRYPCRRRPQNGLYDKEKTEELPSESYGQREIDQTSAPQRPSTN
ncbi:hypothetical protein HPB50_018880 [Hyalomma asiaticum]|uniref:Uncharacterized protein n=1 Tax=Hyalomma asiaticum TaxID=266040 RepID=A0ACB7TM59_HYAAI|nr:hypothetical protein HPB50_018880 [Hyalomma asiaticum]